MGIRRRLTDWVETSFGLKSTFLRPAPEYSLNPFYWLGALAVIAFLIQAVTGLLMLIYYVPTTDQAYPTTQYIVNSVPLGSLLETVHLYGAYSMILLALLHMFRGYFESAHRAPRQAMWVIGMLMGLVVLGFGLTGYLLTWTVVSKSATDVSIGMLNFLPAQIGPTLTFLLAGIGSDASELARFFDLHIIVLPAALLSLLGLKMWMFEAHGAAEPSTGAKTDRNVPWFPEVLVYFMMVAASFVAFVLIASVIFPLALPPEFTPSAAANYVPQPEWYFLWIYQLLKFSAFEGNTCIAGSCFPNIYWALSLVTLVILGLILLPFIDRGSRRHPAKRPVYVALGAILAAELVVMTVWGYLTPGEVIPNLDAAGVTFGTAAAVALAVLGAYRLRSAPKPAATVGTAAKAMALPFTHAKLTSLFLLPLLAGAGVLANAVDLVQSPGPNILLLAGDAAVLGVSLYVMVRMLKLLIGPKAAGAGRP